MVCVRSSNSVLLSFKAVAMRASIAGSFFISPAFCLPLAFSPAFTAATEFAAAKYICNRKQSLSDTSLRILL